MTRLSRYGKTVLVPVSSRGLSERGLSMGDGEAIAELRSLPKTSDYAWLRRILVRLGMIWPLQAALPAICVYTLYRWRSAAPLWSKGVHVASLWRWVLWRLGKQFVRTWVSLELCFAVYYFIRRRRLQEKAIMPQCESTSDERRALGDRCLQAIEEIDFDFDYNKQPTKRQAPTQSNQPQATGMFAKRSMSDSALDRDRARSDMELLLRSLDKDTANAKQVDSFQIYHRKLALKRACVSGWFLGAEVTSIFRGNLVQWVAWAFFLKRPEELTDRQQVEAESLVDRVAAWAQVDFKDGFNDCVKCIRLEFDPIPATYRPLLFYVVTGGVVSVATDVILGWWYGFQKLKSGSLTYWYRGRSPSDGDPAACEDPPIVFCHGLGIGTLSYVSLIHAITQRQPHRTLIMIELPHISMRPVENQASPTELVTAISNLLQAHRCLPGGAHFVGHSFGSLVLAWIARFRPDMACQFTFCDPVCFLLCKHDVAYNFLYKSPTNAQELLMQWVVGRELYIAYSLTRRFQWQQNILWPEHIADIPTTVILSSEDHIVPSHSVRRFLVSWERRRVEQCNVSLGTGALKKQAAPHLAVVWLEGCGHAGFLLSSEAHATIVDAILVHKGSDQSTN